MADNLPVFISPEQLDAARERADVQVVAVADAATHTQLRLPGALHIAITDFVASQPPTAGLLPDSDTLEQAFANAGLNNDVRIVAYDHGNGTQAARLAYTLQAMGHDAASVLDGGPRAWEADGFKLEHGEFASPEPGTFRAEPNAERIADHRWIRAHLEDADTRIIDVRSADEYSGADVRSARGGHIPGAIHLEWRDFLQADGRLKPEAELRALLNEHDIAAHAPSVMYCQSHMRSSLTYLVLRALGHDRVRGYPGAWSDWGNRDDTPVSTAT